MKKRLGEDETKVGGRQVARCQIEDCDNDGTIRVIDDKEIVKLIEPEAMRAAIVLCDGCYGALLRGEMEVAGVINESPKERLL